MPKLIAAVKCSTYDCACFAFDEPEYVACLQVECGRGYDSVRAAQVMGCSIYDVTLSPNPPAATPTSPVQASPSTTLGSGNENENGNGNGSGSDSSGSGDTTRTGSVSGSGSSNETSKSGLSTGELIGIIIGGVSAVATIVGVWVAVNRRKKDRKGSASTPSSGYYQQIGVQQVVLPTNNFPTPFPPVNPNMYQPPHSNAQPMPMHYPQGPPPKYEQPQK